MARLRDYPFAYSYGASDDRLNDFYIPALSASVHYDRSAGFFSSYTLAIAAAGISRLIANGGRMRLLVGAQLDHRDVQAIKDGYDLRERVGEITAAQIPEDAQGALKDRLEALAWMVATGTLEIKVVLPVGPNGLPLPQEHARDYYHPKTGIFTDASGDRIMFTGSSNESQAGWVKNYEEFLVLRSWEGGDIYIRQGQARFNRLWDGKEPDWMALPVPVAVRQKLLRYTPAQAPVRDPLEKADENGPDVDPAAQQRERLILQFIKDAPHLAGARGLGTATSAVEPWPHQAYLARQIVDTFPRRYLIADEVGLGKTISAGLSIRELYLSGRARRILILTPKSVLRQWQEELYEKFALNVPRYDGSGFVDVHDEVRLPGAQNPWNEVDFVLASSQLVKRRERQDALIAAEPWDLVVVDEAHHARRRDFLDMSQYRPNRLLQLLLKLEGRTRGLLLLTATPMQVHPIEVWDLLQLLGLTGAWAASGQNYLKFFNELRKGVLDADWRYIFDLVRSEIELAGLDPNFERQARPLLGPVEWQRIADLPNDRNPSKIVHLLTAKGQEFAVSLARRHTPLRRLVFRNTRALLRRYIERGLLDATVATRRVQPVWVTMREHDERHLYDRIEEYISEFYQKYEAERKGLGFVMTVYRRRLTSSFYAVRRSLERRLNSLRGLVALDGDGEFNWLDDDDLQEDLPFDLDEQLEDVDLHAFRSEIAYLEDFLAELQALSHNDSKVEQLLTDLQQIFRDRDKVIIFTQYTDTMDFLRERLRNVYGKQVACYSGRGGERYDGITWVNETKEDIKNAFRHGEELKILLCTEAASEGLNLQTCGVLLNFDMPWNPMRVEQRIGRVDRIGQKYPEVWIRNYFYEDTVEADVYRALEDRIEWFENVVGRLQPILGQVGRMIQLVAMAPVDDRDSTFQKEIEQVREALDKAEAGFDLDEWANEAQADGSSTAPLTLEDLEEQLLTLPSTRSQLKPHPMIEGAYMLRINREQYAVTFRRACYDEHPDTVQLLTYGNQLLDALLDRALSELPHVEANSPILRLETSTPTHRIGWYLTDGAMVRRVRALNELDSALPTASPATQVEFSNQARIDAEQDFQQLINNELTTQDEQQELLISARKSAWQARARQILLQSALTQIALNQQNGLFGGIASFDESAIQTLAQRGYPFAPLLRAVDVDGMRLSPTDPMYVGLQGLTVRQLEQKLAGLKDNAASLLNEYMMLR